MEAVVERAANLEEAAECEVSWVFPLCCNSKKEWTNAYCATRTQWTCLAWYHSGGECSRPAWGTPLPCDGRQSGTRGEAADEMGLSHVNSSEAVWFHSRIWTTWQERWEGYYETYIYIYICDLDIFALGDYAMYIYIYVIYWIILDILEWSVQGSLATRGANSTISYTAKTSSKTVECLDPSGWQIRPANREWTQSFRNPEPFHAGKTHTSTGIAGRISSPCECLWGWVGQSVAAVARCCECIMCGLFVSIWCSIAILVGSQRTLSWMVLIVSSDVASDYAELWFHVLRTSTTYPRRGPYRIILSHFLVVDGCCLAFVLWHAVALRSFFDVLRCSWGVPRLHREPRPANQSLVLTYRLG